MILKSTAFVDGGMISSRYTCDGRNVSPPLSWEEAPAKTRTFALICDDPDAPSGDWVHWVIYDLPPDLHGLPEGVATVKVLPDGSKQGINDSVKIGYDGPYPPGGTHRYYFKLYALDASPGLAPGKTKADVLSKMKGHVLAQAQLMGKYSRQK
jgi:Raf kinase inhibitor-like YbhB/YbcL family protein